MNRTPLNHLPRISDLNDHLYAMSQVVFPNRKKLSHTQYMNSVYMKLDIEKSTIDGGFTEDTYREAITFMERLLEYEQCLWLDLLRLWEENQGKTGVEAAQHELLEV